MLIWFLTKDLRVFKSRGSEGVKALSLAQKDEVISLSILNNVILDFLPVLFDISSTIAGLPFTLA